MRITSTGDVRIFSSSPPAVVGTCSNCGGRVAVPTFVQVGHTDETPTCLDCGARKREPAYGPVVDMVPAFRKRA